MAPRRLKVRTISHRLFAKICGPNYSSHLCTAKRRPVEPAAAAPRRRPHRRRAAHPNLLWPQFVEVSSTGPLHRQSGGAPRGPDHVTTLPGLRLGHGDLCVRQGASGVLFRRSRGLSLACQAQRRGVWGSRPNFGLSASWNLLEFFCAPLSWARWGWAPLWDWVSYGTF